jgi:hypothetical protein
MSTNAHSLCRKRARVCARSRPGAQHGPAGGPEPGHRAVRHVQQAALRGRAALPLLQGKTRELSGKWLFSKAGSLPNLPSFRGGVLLTFRIDSWRLCLTSLPRKGLCLWDLLGLRCGFETVPQVHKGTRELPPMAASWRRDRQEVMLRGRYDLLRYAEEPAPWVEAPGWIRV